MYGGVVKFHALTDTDRAGTEYNDFLFIADFRFVPFPISRVEVGDISAAAACFNHFVYREQLHVTPQLEHIHFFPVPEFRDNLVGEARFFSGFQDFPVPDILRKYGFIIHNVFHNLEEIFCDFCCLENIVQRNAVADELRNGIDSVVRAAGDILQQFFAGRMVEFRHVQVADANFQRADGFQQAFLQCASDAHNFACCFHLCTERICGGRKFIEGEAGHFCYNIIQSRFKISGGFRNFDFVQRHADSNFCRNAGDRVTAGFGSKRGGTGNTRVDLNQIILGGIRVKRELHIAAAFNFQCANDFQRAVPQHIEIMVVQCQDWRHNDRIAGMYANGVNVFHTADGNGAVGCIAHDFKFDFLIAFNALFYQYLMYGREFEGVFHDIHQFTFVFRKAAACAAECECRAQYNGIADFICRLDGFFYGVCDFRRDNGLANALAEFFEQLSVLGALDAFAACTQQLDLTFVQYAFLFQLHGKVQTCLPADARDDSVRAFIAEDSCDVFQCKRFHVNLIGDGCIGHDGSGVGINQYHLVTFFFQCKARLCACVVKFCGLPDYNGAGADNQNFFQVCSLWHNLFSSLKYIKTTGIAV